MAISDSPGPATAGPHLSVETEIQPARNRFGSTVNLSLTLSEGETTAEILEALREERLSHG